MNEPQDPNLTVDNSSAPSDSLEAGLAAAFGVPSDGPQSVLAPLTTRLGKLRPVLLRDAEGDSNHVVRPKSDAMPTTAERGDRYQLAGEIARGGMGAVLRGRDVDLGRDLAVKVLLEKHAKRPEVIRRFLEEAQIGGQLQHPGVVPVYDIGRFGERPFFTMKLVKGQTLAALLAARPDASADRPRLLGIALQVAQTVAYAHAKGVIHRDLKPANVMVGAFGEVQVMDWGLAKVLAEGGVADEERATRQHQEREDVTTIRTARSLGSNGGVGSETEAGSLMGTPAYMPPEQANGDVAHLDRRADVFGLGAVLCEILTGKPPYVGRSSDEVRRKAANGDLAEAYTRLDGCGADGELIALVVSCLAAEPADRPADAKAVADGLTEYLDGVQTRLRQAELAEAAAKAKAEEESKRRRVTLALAATVLLAVTLGGGSWVWLKADHEARQTQLARDVNEALNKATALREQSKAPGAGASALAAQAREQMQRASALVESGPADAMLRDQVRRLAAELDQDEKDRSLLTALDAARLVQSETLSDVNRFAREKAVPLFRTALQAYGLEVGAGDPKAAAENIRGRPAAVREAIAAALNEWIDVANRPKLKLVEPHLDWLKAAALEVEPGDEWTRKFREAGEEKDAEKRREALEKLAENADVRVVPVTTLKRLATNLDDLKSVASGIRLLRRAQERHQGDFWLNTELGLRLKNGPPPRPEEAVRFLTAAVALRPDSPGTHLNLGLALAESGRKEEGVACFRKAIELDPKYTAAHSCLGKVLSDLGRLDEAVACCRKVIELDPKNAAVLMNMGNTLSSLKRHDEAVASIRKAIALDPTLREAHTNLGIALKQMGRLDEAVACFRQAVKVNAEYAPAYSSLAIELEERGEREEAIRLFKKAIELDPQLAEAHRQLGSALEHAGRTDEAIASYLRALELEPKDVAAHGNLGIALEKAGRLEEAVASQRRAAELEPKSARCYYNLGCALRTNRQTEEAVAAFRKATELDPKHAGAHNNLGALLSDMGQLDAAAVWIKKSIEIDPKQAAPHNNLGSVLLSKGKTEEAVASFRKAVELDPKYATGRQNLGRALLAAHRPEEAVASYRKTIELDPKDPGAHVNLGIALQLSGKKVEALAAFRKAIEVDPKFAPAHDVLGIALKEMGQLDDAIAAHRKAIEIDGKSAGTYHHLGLALAGKRLWSEAIAAYRKAVELDPKLAAAFLDLGNVLLEERQWDHAVAAFRKCLEIQPKVAVAHSNIGRALSAQGRWDEAVAAYRRAIEVDPKFEPALNNLGNVLSDQGRFDEAIALYKKAIELNPKLPSPWNNMGNALRRKKQFDEAIANCRKAVELDPKYAVAYHNIGLALADQRRWVEAVAAYRKAIEFDAKSAATYFDLGYALGRNGQMDEAIAAYRKAVEIDPKNVNAYINQGAALMNKNRWDDAVAAFRKAVELEPKRVHAQANLGVALLNKGLTDEAVERLRAAAELDPDDLEVRKILEGATRLATGRDKVARFRNGDFTPADNADRLEMVEWCKFRNLNYTATKLMEAVIAADPKAADDVKLGHRYNAACYATLAADGQGADAGALDESARTRFRRQALDWIRADLAGWTKKLESDKAADRAEIAQYVGHWQKDPDLISVRDEAPLMKLSAEERAAFTTLWTDVAALLKKCEPTKGEAP